MNWAFARYRCSGSRPLRFDGVKFCRKAAAGATEGVCGLTQAPPSGILMSPHDGRIEDRADILVDLSAAKEVEPPATQSPAPKPVVDTFPGTQTHVQVSPRRSCPDPPDDGMNEVSLILFRTWPAALRQSRSDSVPLFVC